MSGQAPERSTTQLFPQIERAQQKLNKLRSQADYNFMPKIGQQIVETPTKLQRKSDSMGKSATLSKDFLKEFGQKLDQHQNEIDMRTQIIEEMERTIDRLKNEFIIEKKAGQEKDQIILQLQDQNEKLNGRIKVIQIKMEEQHTKILHYEKQLNGKALCDVEDIAKKDEEIKRLKQLEEQLNKQLKELTSKLETTQSSYEEKLKTSNSEKDSIKQSLEKQINQIKGDFESTKTENQELKQKIQQLQQEISKSQHSSSEISELKAQIEKLKKELEDFKKQNQDLTNQVKQLSSELQTIKDRENEATKRNSILLDQKTDLEKLKFELDQQIQKNKGFQEKNKQENDSLSKQMKEKEEQFKKTQLEMEEKIKQSQNEIETIKKKLKENDDNMNTMKQDNMSQRKKIEELMQQLGSQKNGQNLIKMNIEKLDQAEKEIMKSLKCNFCNKFIQEPITIIPCGHSFCFNCKKAYTKECIKCGPKVKIEAMYRNELLDDIIAMVKLIQTTKESLRTMQ